MIKDKKQISAVIIIFILVLVLGIVSYAFFNYTKTSNMNNVTVGRINFQSSQNNTINLTNVFPTDSAHLDSTNSSTVTINISGDTDYDKGIEYKVSIVEVENTVNNKEIPISFNVTASNLGTKSNDYYNERGSTSNVFNLLESGLAENDTEILIGYIKPDENGINGSINITAYIDKENIGISDTVSRIENNNLVYGETPGDWIDGRTILTTTEWNSLSLEGISFKVKVEAIEGTWSQQTEYYVMKNLYLASDSNWSSNRANITSVEFHTDGVAPANSIVTIDATDLTSAGPVTMYLVDDGLGNSTYKAVVVAADTIYAPENSQGLFRNMTKLVTFNSTNFKVDLATTLHTFFANDENLENISTISTWNTSNVTTLRSMFQKNYKISNVDALANWDTSKVTTLYNMFNNCTSLQNLDGLINWDTSNVVSMELTFNACAGLKNVDGLINWNTSKVQTVELLFYGCSSLVNTNGLINWNTSKLTSMNSLFSACSSLKKADGIVNWDTSRVIDMGNLFMNCSSLEEVNLNKWNTSSVLSMGAMFSNCTSLKSVDISSFNMSSAITTIMFNCAGFSTLKMPNNYAYIGDYMFNHASSYKESSFTIPKTVKYLGVTHMFYDFGKDGVFNKFIVEDGNTVLKTIDDILYSYDGKKLIAVPRGKTFANKTFELPEGLTLMTELSFSRNKNIDTLVLPNSYVIDRYIDANNNNYGFSNTGNSLSLAVYAYTSIKWYEVKNDNPNYISDNGCIYSKDGTELIAVPLHYNGVLNIKSGTTTIGQEAFWTYADMIQFIDSITQINIPASVTTIEANQLTVLNRLMSRSTNPVTITIDSGNTSYRISNNQIVAI